MSRENVHQLVQMDEFFLSEKYSRPMSISLAVCANIFLKQCDCVKCATVTCDTRQFNHLLYNECNFMVHMILCNSTAHHWYAQTHNIGQAECEYLLSGYARQT